MSKLLNTLESKEYVPNTLGTVLLLTTSLIGKIFALISPYLTSILNTKTKCVLSVMTATGLFNVKRLFKNNYQNASFITVPFL